MALSNKLITLIPIAAFFALTGFQTLDPNVNASKENQHIHKMKFYPKQTFKYYFW